MPKNNLLIKQARALELERKKLHDEIDSVTPQVYAAFAITLKRDYGWSTEQIRRLFGMTQEVWAECLEDGLPICDICLREVDIEVRPK